MRDVGVCGKGSGASRLERVGVADPTGERHVNTDGLIDPAQRQSGACRPRPHWKDAARSDAHGRRRCVYADVGDGRPSCRLCSIIHVAWTAVKLFFALSLIATAALLLLKSMRPGLEKETHPGLLFVPFFAAIATA